MGEGDGVGVLVAVGVAVGVGHRVGVGVLVMMGVGVRMGSVALPSIGAISRIAVSPASVKNVAMVFISCSFFGRP